MVVSGDLNRFKALMLNISSIINTYTMFCPPVWENNTHTLETISVKVGYSPPNNAMHINSLYLVKNARPRWLIYLPQKVEKFSDNFILNNNIIHSLNRTLTIRNDVFYGII